MDDSWQNGPKVRSLADEDTHLIPSSESSDCLPAEAVADEPGTDDAAITEAISQLTTILKEALSGILAQQSAPEPAKPLRLVQPTRDIFDRTVLWLNREEASRYTGMSVATISNWVTEGKIRTRPFGKERYDKISIERFINTGEPQGESAAVRRKRKAKRTA